VRVESKIVLYNSIELKSKHLGAGPVPGVGCSQIFTGHASRLPQVHLAQLYRSTLTSTGDRPIVFYHGTPLKNVQELKYLGIKLAEMEGPKLPQGRRHATLRALSPES